MAEFPEEPIYEQLARVGKALASPVRLRLLDVLDQRERTVEELAQAAGVPLKNTSAQLQQLRAARLVTSRKDGPRVYYRLADERVSRFLGDLQGFAHDRLAELRDAVRDRLGSLEGVTADELAARLTDPGTVIVDVRPSADYAAGHLPGAISLPMAELRERLAELREPAELRQPAELREPAESRERVTARPGEAEIVAYCGGPYCVVSPEAVRMLRDHGYYARPLDGGFLGWRRGDRPLERS
ncbi:MAG TPA: metalloregulator ArsR/SmtB family transcription factor [Nonomuraea sp.]|nr:metalloregulator ArsR/SmtB family transcription factor [Nonomuraea sp.]